MCLGLACVVLFGWGAELHTSLPTVTFGKHNNAAMDSLNLLQLPTRFRDLQYFASVLALIYVCLFKNDEKTMSWQILLEIASYTNLHRRCDG